MTREMMDSGVEWVQEIPSNWKLSRLRFLCDIKTGNKDTINRVDDGEFDFFVRSPKVEKINTYTFDGEAILTAGDGVGAGKVFHYANGKFDYHQRVYNLHNFKGIVGGFLFYFMKVNFIKEIEKGTAKSTVDSIRLPMLQNFPICLPPKEEQQRIAAYLDKKISRIEAIIDDTSISINDLKKYKQSLITETVTKGLNSQVNMKKSNIDWVGDIPEHWNVHFLNQLFRQVKDKNTNLAETNLLSLSYGKVVKKNIDSKEGLLPESFEGYNKIDVGDIVLRMTDLQNDHTSLRVGLAPEKGIITSAYITIRMTQSLIPKYAYYFLHSFDIYKGFYGMGSGVRQGVTYSLLKKLEILTPPLNEQQQIVGFLDQKCEHIEHLIEQKQQLLIELEKYKTAFIYEYVTGKKEVL